jgi:hypothetical protein
VVRRRQPSGGATGLEGWNPKLPANLDPTKIDPTLRLDVLAKLQAINLEGGERNIFTMGTKAPEVAAAAVPKTGKINLTPPPVTTVSSTPVLPQPLGPPPAPPINLKYYGYSTKRSDGEKKAFFLDGDDIIVAAEGDIIKKQYKVVRIGVNSVQMEDTTSKSTQTLPLQQEAAPA